MTFELFIKVLAATLETGTPILFATLGSIITERSGVLNLGVEGMMIVGAFVGFVTEYTTGSPYLGLLMAGCASAALAGLHGTVCLVFRGSQVVSGLALTILGLGIADYLGTPYLGHKVTGFSPVPVPGLSAIPYIGDVFFNHSILVYISYVLVPVICFMLHRTRWGLALRAVGENPLAVMTAGLSPYKLRWAGVLLGGFLIGIGGAYLALVLNHGWTQNISAGRGWIAIALVIFAFWRPERAMLGAYLFCGVAALQSRLQSSGVVVISGWLLNMFPYLLTLLVLLFSSARGHGRKAPASLGVNLEPGD